MEAAGETLLVDGGGVGDLGDCAGVDDLGDVQGVVVVNWDSGSGSETCDDGSTKQAFALVRHLLGVDQSLENDVLGIGGGLILLTTSWARGHTVPITSQHLGLLILGSSLQPGPRRHSWVVLGAA